MKENNISRRDFIRRSSLTAAAVTLSGEQVFPEYSRQRPKNKLPRWRGFNLLDFFTPAPPRNPGSSSTTADDLRWMADWGFDFVRIPMAYPRYLDFDRSRDITREEVYKFDNRVLEEVDNLIMMANRNGLHVSLNLHRGPGYCINAGFHEPFNLWKDNDARDAFNAHWAMWAERYKGISAKKLSFDLLNEPAYIEDMNDQYARKGPVPGDIYHDVAKGAVDAIRKISPGRLIIADGNSGGNNVVPELADLGIGQSCRGYFPHYVSHYQASWVWKDPSKAPKPVWPGTIDGKSFGRGNLEDFYKPWTGLIEKGIGVHCGECGCYKKTPHDVFLAWFEDVISILTGNDIGYALWNFRGDFGIMNSGRTDVDYTDWYGQKLDKKLLDLLKRY
jgi:aryl-phospho-beta-D-glucosidase BglC (GH1 family)